MKLITHIKYLTIIVFSFYQILNSEKIHSQTTSIPDSNFEQTLINLGIDSNGIINGQVLTSDIEAVIILDISLNGISDLTGVEDFAALEILDVSSNDLTVLDVSNNIHLKEIYASNTGTENLAIASLDLSNNVNLEVFYGENLFFLESLNLKNGNNSLLTVTLPCEEEGIPCELPLNCVMVDDESAATNNEAPYSNWYIQADYVYSEDCTLGVPTHLANMISIYPNPTHNKLLVMDNKKIIKRIDVYDISGKLILTELSNFDVLHLSEFEKGVYILKIETDYGPTTKRIIKE